ncbi:MAG: restriction endonuclease subunit S, partial [Deltaproteobacteria bacterium]|nr:restriction endonuclease subunit S [Deltaproteobacteria bacterium]
QSVLKSAFEGKLTAEWRKANKDKIQPASALLEKIAKEKKQKTKGKKQKKLPPLNTSSLPQLPDGWEWCRIGQVGDVQLGRQRSPKHHSGPHMRPYLRVANVFENRIDLSSVYEMNFTPSEYEIYALRYGDILLNEGQSLELVGRPAMFRDEIEGVCFQNTLVRFRSSDCIDKSYCLYAFLNQFYQKRYQKIARWTTSIAHLGATRFSNIEFPLCGPAEQKVIVQEIERHYSIADKAEEVVKAALKQSGRLRQSILKRAFEGKLVPQDPNDEPAEKLLSRIMKNA